MIFLTPSRIRLAHNLYIRGEPSLPARSRATGVMRDPDLPPLTKRIRAIKDPDEATRMYGWLSRLLAQTQVRILQLCGDKPAAVEPDGDRMLKAAEASRLFGVSRSWLYEHGERLGLARRPAGMRGVRFSEKALRLWSEGRRE